MKTVDASTPPAAPATGDSTPAAADAGADAENKQQKKRDGASTVIKPQNESSAFTWNPDSAQTYD